MVPSKEYLDHISKRLEAMNPHLKGTDGKYNAFADGFKMPSLMDQMGQTAMAYLNNKKNQAPIEPDPLFPDRNSY
jgi:hypothetical protein